jgi:hypothetical protein
MDRRAPICRETAFRYSDVLKNMRIAANGGVSESRASFFLMGGVETDALTLPLPTGLSADARFGDKAAARR